MNGRYDDEYGGIDIWGESHSSGWTDIDGRLGNGDVSGGFGGSCYGRNESYDNHSDYTSTTYKYQFKDEESLITSEVFQKCLGQSLAHKDRIIRELQEEILNGK